MVVYYGDLKIKTHLGVYEPSDDSFLLAENLSVRDGERVLDVGTGTGFLALLASMKAGHVIGVDVNNRAVQLAEENAHLNGVGNVEFKVSNLFQNVDGKFDLIIFNPPYLPDGVSDPRDVSWSGGKSGFDVILTFVESAHQHLKTDGRFMLVLSSLCNPKRIAGGFGENGFDYSVVAEKKLFFESLYVVEGRRK